MREGKSKPQEKKHKPSQADPKQAESMEVSQPTKARRLQPREIKPKQIDPKENELWQTRSSRRPDENPEQAGKLKKSVAAGPLMHFYPSGTPATTAPGVDAPPIANSLRFDLLGLDFQAEKLKKPVATVPLMHFYSSGPPMATGLCVDHAPPITEGFFSEVEDFFSVARESVNVCAKQDRKAARQLQPRQIKPKQVEPGQAEPGNIKPMRAEPKQIRLAIPGPQGQGSNLPSPTVVLDLPPVAEVPPPQFISMIRTASPPDPPTMTALPADAPPIIKDFFGNDEDFFGEPARGYDGIDVGNVNLDTEWSSIADEFDTVVAGIQEPARDNGTEWWGAGHVTDKCVGEMLWRLHES